MSESPQGTEREIARQEYVELTKKQTKAVGWTPEDRARLLELKKSLGIDQPTLTKEQENALRHQGTAGIQLGPKQELQPPLTDEEKKLIKGINYPLSKPSK